MADPHQQESDLQDTRDKVEQAMGEIFGALHHQAITDELKHAAKVGIIAKLKQLQSGGYLPGDINMVYVTIAVSSQDPGILDVQLPWFLRAFLQEGPTYNVPRFKQDYENCTFLAHVNGHDLYYCNQLPWMPTITARYGNEGGDYMSGMEFGRTGQVEELRVAYNLAREKGLLKDDAPTVH